MILLAIVVVPIAALVLVMTTFSGSDGSPEAIGRAYLTAVDASDCDELVELTAGELGETYAEACDGPGGLAGQDPVVAEPGDLDYVGRTSGTEETRVYFVDGTGEGYVELDLVQDPGWLVTGFDVSSDGQPPEGLDG